VSREDWEWEDASCDKIVGAEVLDILGAEEGSESVRIVTARGTLHIRHEEDCGESVSIVDVTGDPKDLVGGIVSVAEERVEDPPENATEIRGEQPESETWTFYEFRTTKGDLTLRWLGTSNGYYSEAAAVRWEPTPAPS
jgi:hypothetical protein